MKELEIVPEGSTWALRVKGKGLTLANYPSREEAETAKRGAELESFHDQIDQDFTG